MHETFIFNGSKLSNDIKSIIPYSDIVKQCNPLGTNFKSFIFSFSYILHFPRFKPHYILKNLRFPSE